MLWSKVQGYTGSVQKRLLICPPWNRLFVVRVVFIPSDVSNSCILKCFLSKYVTFSFFLFFYKKKQTKTTKQNVYCKAATPVRVKRSRRLGLCEWCCVIIKRKYWVILYCTFNFAHFVFFHYCKHDVWEYLSLHVKNLSAI